MTAPFQATGTQTGLALDLVRTSLLTAEAGHVANRQVSVIVVTDGMTQETAAALLASATALKNVVSNVFAVAVGIDVNIDENRSDKIVIYSNDEPWLLAQAFAKKHSLSDELKEKLYVMIKAQINSILEKIDEEDEI